jgi:uncharacterized protein DUF222
MSSITSDIDPGTLGSAVGDAYKGLCASLCSLLAAVAEHDRTEAYKVSGLKAESEWLKRTFDLEWRTVHDWTRQARLIAANPEIGERLAAGELSIDALRTMAAFISVEQPESLKPKGPFDEDTPPDPSPSPVPVPDPDPGPGPRPSPGPGPGPGQMTTAELLAMLDELSARDMAAKLAAARAEEARRRDRWRTRHLNVFRSDGEARLAIRDGALFEDDAAVVFAAFEDYAGRCGLNPETGTRDPLGMRYADALRAMADAYLAERERTLGHPLVVFHADAAVLAGDDNAWAAAPDHSPLAADIIRRLACFSKITLAGDDPDGNPLFLGRTQRLASWQQEHMIMHRDGGCRGCGSTVGLEIHHLHEWAAEFGLTNIDQLVAGCRGCHHLIHDHGWRLDGHPNHEIRLLDPGGTVRHTSRPHPRHHQQRRPPTDRMRPPPDAATGDGGAVDQTDACGPATLW